LNRTKLPVWIAFAILLPALFSAFSIYRRNQAESFNRATAFAAEYDTLENLAAAQGMTVDQAIDKLKPQGLNAVVLSEETMAELIGRGRATISPGLDGTTVLNFPFDPDGARVRKALEIRLQKKDFSGGGQPFGNQGNRILIVPMSPNIIRATSIGLNPDQAANAKKHGLIIVARCANPPGVSTKTVQQTLAWAHDLGATVFLPEGDQVLGRREAITTTIDTLNQLGMLYASAEFAKIGGDEEVLRTDPGNVVRLHSAQAAELDKLTLPDAVERYVKASRERNMRILLIRPFSYGAEEPLTAFSDFLHLIGERIVKEGGALGNPKPFSDPHMPRWYPALIGLSIVPAGFFVGCAFFKNRKIQIVGAVLLTLLGLASISHSGLQLMGLVATIVFPTAAFLVLDAWRPKNVVLGFIVVTAISFVGGLCVAGMMNGLPFYVKAQEFSGVKLSIFLPILIVGYLFMDRLADMKQVWKSPITWGSAGLGLAIIVVLALMIARTGNDSGVGASGGEMVFRNLLDRFLFVRPRTKEFMIGHPLLVLGIGMLAYLNRAPKKTPLLGGWVALLIMVGSMGQTSIVNTLTHLHIPVVLSLARIGIGAVLGCIIGLGLWTIASRLLPRGEEA